MTRNRRVSPFWTDDPVADAEKHYAYLESLEEDPEEWAEEMGDREYERYRDENF